MGLNFVAFDERVTEDWFVGIDGASAPGHPNQTLDLTHWARNAAPEYLKATTAIEMALKLIRMPEWRTHLGSAEVLTNNHYDTDGVLACWILMEPEKILPYIDLLVAAGMAGDHGVYSTPEGVKLDLLLTNLEDFIRSPVVDRLSQVYVERTQFLYDWVLDHLPGLLEQIDDYPELWQPEHEAIVEGLYYIASGGGTIREHKSAILGVIESDRWLPPMVRRSRTQGGRLLTIVPKSDKTLIELEYTLWTFHDMPDRERIQLPDLSETAVYFNQLETSTAGRWVYDTSYLPVPKLHFVNERDELIPSSLDPKMVEQYFINYFAPLGDTWVYLDESPWGRVVNNEIVPVVTIWDM